MKKKSKSSESYKENLFDKEDVIYEYTSKQAEEDGILFDLTKVSPSINKSPFNYVTANLINKGYLKEEKYAVANILDLIHQAFLIMEKGTKNFTQPDYFFSGKIELPNGEMQEIFIEQNETGKFTIMLPEDR